MFSGAIKEALSRFFKVDELMEHLSAYVETRVALLKLEVREEVAKAITRVMVLGVVMLFGIFVLLFLSVGFALLINEYYGKKFIGFFIVGGIYFVLLLISYLFRKQILSVLEGIFNKHLKHHKD